jgi:hypothetical protein
LTVNSLITDPGAFEMEWYGSFDDAGVYRFPTTWKLTPAEAGFWGRTELSASFDALDVYSFGGARAAQFSDHLTLTSTSVLKTGGVFSIAAAPSATFLLRGGEGSRLGGAVLARADWDLNQAGFYAAWSGATSPSEGNPAGAFDLSGALGRQFAPSGRWSKFTAHGEALWERVTGGAWATTVTEGLEYEVTERLSLQFAAQQTLAAGADVDRPYTGGIVWNLGSFRKLGAGIVGKRRTAAK